jgi:hypothetical protein
MLKNGYVAPAQPRRAASSTRFVLGSMKSSTYPTRERAAAARGWAGEEYHASGFFSPAALLNGHVDHPSFTH